MIYFDTDVIIHSIVIQDKEKHRASVALIRQAIANNQFFISFLVLQETAFVLSKLRFSSQFIDKNVTTYSNFTSFNYSEKISPEPGNWQLM